MHAKRTGASARSAGRSTSHSSSKASGRRPASAVLVDGDHGPMTGTAALSPRAEKGWQRDGDTTGGMKARSSRDWRRRQGSLSGDPPTPRSGQSHRCVCRRVGCSARHCLRWPSLITRDKINTNYALDTSQASARVVLLLNVCRFMSKSCSFFLSVSRKDMKPMGSAPFPYLPTSLVDLHSATGGRPTG